MAVHLGTRPTDKKGSYVWTKRACSLTAGFGQRWGPLLKSGFSEVDWSHCMRLSCSQDSFWGVGGIQESCANYVQSSPPKSYNLIGFRVWGLGFRVWGLGFGV